MVWNRDDYIAAAIIGTIIIISAIIALYLTGVIPANINQVFKFTE